MELIDAPREDCYSCLCGNAPDDEGLYPCDRAGQVVEPDQNWPGLSVCDRCGRIVDATTDNPNHQHGPGRSRTRPAGPQ